MGELSNMGNAIARGARIRLVVSLVMAIAPLVVLGWLCGSSFLACMIHQDLAGPVFWLQFMCFPFAAVIFGVVLGLYGLGMVVGALAAPTILRRLPFGVVIAIGPVAGLAASLVMTLTIWTPTPVFAAASLFLLGVGPILWVISTTTLRQAVTPQRLLGRVSSFSVLAQGSRPLGAALGAGIGAVAGAEACLVVAVAGFLVQAAVILASPAVRLAQQPTVVAEAGPA